MYWKTYDKAVSRTLVWYESWVLPKHSSRMSLRDLKLQEFRERKQLLNPITSQSLIEAATDEEKFRLEKLQKMTSFSTLQDFPITSDRHAGLYGYRTQNFKNSYNPYDSPLEYVLDPDWSVKMEPKRINLKKWLFGFALFVMWLRYRLWKVAHYDHLKRVEQRAMLNEELKELENKTFTFTLFQPDGSEYAPNSLTYYILWYDAKMKNYESLVEFVTKKRVVRAPIKSILVVD